MDAAFKISCNLSKIFSSIGLFGNDYLFLLKQRIDADFMWWEPQGSDLEKFCPLLPLCIFSRLLIHTGKLTKHYHENCLFHQKNQIPDEQMDKNPKLNPRWSNGRRHLIYHEYHVEDLDLVTRERKLVYHKIKTFSKSGMNSKIFRNFRGPKPIIISLLK